MKDFLDTHLFNNGDYAVTLFHIVQVILLLVASWLVRKLAKRVVKRQIAAQNFDEGRGLAFYQIVKYAVIILTLLVGLDLVGIKLTILLAGSAALLVGVGLGLQQLFNDIVCGVFLLFEGTVTPGDIVEIEDVIGKVQEISIRTSKIQTRDGIVIIVPNSKLVSDNVINWSHNRDVTRFNVKVGVAYGSDLQLVVKLLEEAANEHPDVPAVPAPTARFINFGDSSLDFELLFYSRKMFEVEFVKSDIRLAIDQKFRDHKVSIPFPQRDLHVKNDSILNLKEQK